MQHLKPSVVVDGLVYAEGIRWHADRLWFSDMLDFKVYAHDPRTGVSVVQAHTADLPSGLGFLPDGRLLVVIMRQRALLRMDPAGLTCVADLSGVCTLMNDMVVDAQGRAYLDAHFGPDSGGIVMVQPDGAWSIVATDMKSPNGLAISADGHTLVVNDLLAHRVVAFDIHPDGRLANQRVFAELHTDSPDGICLDRDGAAWVGLPFQGRFRRILEGGRVTHEISCHDKWAVAPVLGGADRRTLYLCTAEINLETILRLMDDPAPARTQCRGWIEAVPGIEVPGAGTP